MGVAVKTSSFAFGSQSLCLQEAANPRNRKRSVRDFPSSRHELVILGFTPACRGGLQPLQGELVVEYACPAQRPSRCRRAETTEEKLASGE